MILLSTFCFMFYVSVEFDLSLTIPQHIGWAIQKYSFSYFHIFYCDYISNKKILIRIDSNLLIFVENMILLWFYYIPQKPNIWMYWNSIQQYVGFLFYKNQEKIAIVTYKSLCRVYGILFYRLLLAPHVSIYVNEFWVVQLISFSAYLSTTDDNAIYWKNHPEILIRTFSMNDFNLKRDKFIFVTFTLHMWKNKMLQ